MKRVAVAQMCSSLDKAQNLQWISRMVKEAKMRGAAFLALPECFDFMGRPGTGDSKREAELIDGPTVNRLREIAAHEKMWLSLGGFHEKLEEATEKIANTHIIIDDAGVIRCSYRKIHLFDVDVDGGYMESKSTVAGTKVELVCDTPVGNIAVTTCYDVRFPELYSILRDMGAEVVLVPSAFMPTTGSAHWHVLLRARAIETQCFVVASAQSGVHNANDAEVERERESYGHSLVVDPNGKVLLDLGKAQNCVGVVDLNFGLMAQLRKSMPVCLHRENSSTTLSHAREQAMSKS